MRDRLYKLGWGVASIALVAFMVFHPNKVRAEGLVLPEVSSTWGDASKLWSVTTLKSYHLNRSVEHNEHNFGLGLEYHFNEDWRAIAGYYDNSYDIHSNYLGFMYMPFHRGHFSAGVQVAEVSGYKEDTSSNVFDYKAYSFTAAPMFSWEYKHFGVNFMALVPPKAHAGVLGLQFKWRW